MELARIYKFDVLRTIAIISVLIIHSSTAYTNTETDMIISGWFYRFLRPCIAIFLFISGYLLANKKFDGKELRKRLKRVLIPYSFFSIIAFLINYHSPIFSGKLNSAILLEMLFKFVLGEAFTIYFFVFIICVLYLTFYFVRKFNISILYVLLFFGIIAIIHHAYISQLLSILNIAPYSKPLSTYHLRSPIWPIYFFLGVYLSEIDFLKKIQVHRKFIIFIWCFIFLIYNSLYFLNFVNIHGYHSIIGAIYSLATIFVLLVISIKFKLVTYISQISYYLFLSHIFVVQLLWRGLDHFSIKMPFWFTLISLLLSFLIPVIIYEAQKLVFKNKFSNILGA